MLEAEQAVDGKIAETAGADEPIERRQYRRMEWKELPHLGQCYEHYIRDFRRRFDTSRITISHHTFTLAEFYKSRRASWRNTHPLKPYGVKSE